MSRVYVVMDFDFPDSYPLAVFTNEEAAGRWQSRYGDHTVEVELDPKIPVSPEEAGE